MFSKGVRELGIFANRTVARSMNNMLRIQWPTRGIANKAKMEACAPKDFLRIYNTNIVNKAFLHTLHKSQGDSYGGVDSWSIKPLGDVTDKLVLVGSIPSPQSVDPFTGSLKHTAELLAFLQEFENGGKKLPAGVGQYLAEPSAFRSNYLANAEDHYHSMVQVIKSYDLNTGKEKFDFRSCLTIMQLPTWMGELNVATSHALANEKVNLRLVDGSILTVEAGPGGARQFYFPMGMIPVLQKYVTHVIQQNQIEFDLFRNSEDSDDEAYRLQAKKKETVYVCRQDMQLVEATPRVFSTEDGDSELRFYPR